MRREKPSEMYDRLSRRELEENLPYEKSMSSSDGQRTAKRLASIYQRQAAEARRRGQ